MKAYIKAWDKARYTSHTLVPDRLCPKSDTDVSRKDALYIKFVDAQCGPSRDGWIRDELDF